MSDRIEQIRGRQQSVNGLEWRVEDARQGGDGPNIVKGHGMEHLDIDMDATEQTVLRDKNNRTLKIADGHVTVRLS